MVIKLSRKAKILMAIAASVCAVAIIVYLWAFDPTQYPAPQCVFKRLTGYDCPGCGTQRALHALLHGRIAEAWHYNAALLPGIVLALLFGLRPRKLRPLLDSTAASLTVLAAVLAWWLARNLF